MGPRSEGEVLKILQVNNGWVVSVWNPEMPAPVPGQPCSQQPVRWWQIYVFATVAEVNQFVATVLAGIEGAASQF